MKVKFNQPFKDFKGNDISAIMSDELCKVLFNLCTSNKAPISSDEKYMAYKLCVRIHNNDEVELTCEEATFLLRICGETLTAGAYGQIRDLIEM